MSQFQAQLGNAPADIVGEIVTFLPFYDILCLWQCGNKSLNRALGPLGGVKRIFLDSPINGVSRYSWPAFLSHFSTLEYLRLDHTIANVSVDMSAAFASLPKTLRHLELPFVTRQLWSEIKMPLSAFFPNLEALKIGGDFEADQLANLPSTLMSLSMSFSSEIEALNVIRALPKHLKRFYGEISDLAGSPAAAQPKHPEPDPYSPSWTFDDLIAPHSPAPTINRPQLDGTSEIFNALPPTLETWAVDFIPLPLGAKLPLTLTHLETYVENDFAEIISKLPRGLMHLNILSSSTANLILPSDLLPASLESLTLRGASYDINPRELPRTLKSLDVLLRAKQPFEFVELPRKLEKLAIRKGGPPFMGYSLRLLPESLTELTLNLETSGPSLFLTDSTMAFLPSNLKHLELETPVSGTITGTGFAALPRSLRYLDVRSMIQFKGTNSKYVEDLPPLLTHLRLGRILDEGGESDWVSKLPRGLTSLSLPMSSLPISSASDFPPSLISLDYPRLVIGKIHQQQRKLRHSKRFPTPSSDPTGPS